MKIMSDINIHLEDKRESRHFFVFLWLMYAVVYMTKNCFSGALSAIVAQGSLTLAQTTFISAAFYIAYTPLQILGGIFADKYSPEKMITVGLLGGAVCNTVIYFNQNYYVMLVTWVLNAIIQFALWPSVFKIMSSQLVRSDRGRMIFYMSFASSGGLIMTYIVSAFLTDWRDNFLISAIVLVISAFILLVYCKHLNPIMKKDKTESAPATSDKNSDKKKMSTAKLFLISGFFTLLPAVLIRTMIENGTKTLSPTMLMQSYENISASTGNLLSIFIIVAGVVGTLLVKLVLFPRIIKNEITAYLIMMIAALPFTVVLRFVGEIPAWLVILSLSMISMSLSATHLLTQYFNMLYIPYGKNGTAAGILNAAASFGLVLQYCVFGSVAQDHGWSTVTTLWIIMVAIGALFCALTVLPAKRFKKHLQGEE